MKVTFKPKTIARVPVANETVADKPVGNKTVVTANKSVVKTVTPTRFLTSGEIKDQSSTLSDKIVGFVMDEINERFSMPVGQPQITQADALQVAINALAIASAIIVLEGANAGLTLEKAREIHDALYRAALNGS